MNDLIFIGILALLLVGGIWLVKTISSRKTGRKSNHPVYQQEKFKRAPHRHAGHPVMHSHSSQRSRPSEDMWRSSRAKTNESHWESGVVVANKILTDSELALEKREPTQGHGMTSIHYTPSETSKRSAKADGSKRKSR